MITAYFVVPAWRIHGLCQSDWPIQLDSLVLCNQASFQATLYTVRHSATPAATLCTRCHVLALPNCLESLTLDASCGEALSAKGRPQQRLCMLTTMMICCQAVLGLIQKQHCWVTTIAHTPPQKQTPLPPLPCHYQSSLTVGAHVTACKPARPSLRHPGGEMVFVCAVSRSLCACSAAAAPKPKRLHSLMF